ncbi:MAG: hypothetical protein IT432_07400 [Phycisphaerales bacterium]|nr:hypothetical protein [Phycisphaerales bacterium]
MDIDDHTNNSTPDGVNSRSQEVWGLRYIDDAMVRLLDKNLDGDCRDSGELFWQLSDAQFSTVAVINKNAVLQERVSYTSYGVGTHRWPHEVNNTGGVTTSGGTSDYGVIDGLATANGGAGTAINNTNYNVAADLNRDGIIDSTDTSIFTSTFGGAKSALASGSISDANGPDNVFGYDGYVYNPDQALYTVRFRWYNATFGRWLQRDPAGYVDGMGLYAYANASPIDSLDPSGLDADPPSWTDDLSDEEIEEHLRKTREEKRQVEQQLRKAKGDECKELSNKKKLLVQEERGLSTAKKVRDQIKRINESQGKKGGGRQDPRQGRGKGRGRGAGFITPGTAIAIGLAGAFLLDNAADALRDDQGKCYRFMQKLKDAGKTGECHPELIQAGRECALDLGDKTRQTSAWGEFDTYIDYLQEACDAAKKNKQSCPNNSGCDNE